MSAEQDYAGAAQWAENQMELDPESPAALRGDAAANAGRKALEDALGKSAQDIQKGLGGRPTLDPDGSPSRLRTVRLGKALDSQLTKAAEKESRDRSSVIRDAIAEYLNKTA